MADLTPNNLDYAHRSCEKCHLKGVRCSVPPEDLRFHAYCTGFPLRESADDFLRGDDNQKPSAILTIKNHQWKNPLVRGYVVDKVNCPIKPQQLESGDIYIAQPTQDEAINNYKHP